MLFYQLSYTYFDRDYNRDLNRPGFWVQIIYGFGFASLTTFYLAHWVFAFSYLALSYRVELVSKGMPEDTYNRRLNWLNAIVCLVNVAIPAIYWVFGVERNAKA